MPKVYETRGRYTYDGQGVVLIRTTSGKREYAGNLDKLDPCTLAYLECALWAASDESIGRNYAICDFTPDATFEAFVTCDSFLREHAALIARSGLSMEQIGHDLWLTRNRHGAGFWDRGLGDTGQRLTALCQHMYKECDVVEVDAGRLCFE